MLIVFVAFLVSVFIYSGHVLCFYSDACLVFREGLLGIPYVGGQNDEVPDRTGSSSIEAMILKAQLQQTSS